MRCGVVLLHAGVHCGNLAGVAGIDAGMMGSVKDIPVTIPVANGRAAGAVDAWVRQDFAARFDRVASEPVPAVLLELLLDLA